MQLNYSEATRQPRTTFKRLTQNSTAVFIGYSVVTKRLKARGINIFPHPKSVTNGFRGQLGRINYAAAIDANDTIAMAAMHEEYERLEIQVPSKGT